MANRFSTLKRLASTTRNSRIPVSPFSHPYYQTKKDKLSELWQKYSFQKSPKLLAPLLARIREMNDASELQKVLREIRQQKVNDPNILQLAVGVTARFEGDATASKLMKELISDGHFGTSFEEKLKFFDLKDYCVSAKDVQDLFTQLKETKSLQTEANWAHFASLCVKKNLNEELQSFREGFSKALDLPLVRATMAKAYMSHRTSDSDLSQVQQLLEPLKKTLQDPQDIFLWNIFLSYYMAAKDEANLRRVLLSKTDLSKFTPKVLHNSLRAAAILGDAQKAEELFAALVTKGGEGSLRPIDRFLLLSAQAVTGNLTRVRELLNDLPLSPVFNFEDVAASLRTKKLPLKTRRQFLALLKEKRIGYLRPYLSLLQDHYTQPQARNSASFLKEILAEMEDLKLDKYLQPRDYRTLLHICSLTNEKDLHSKYSKKLAEKKDIVSR